MKPISPHAFLDGWTSCLYVHKEAKEKIAAAIKQRDKISRKKAFPSFFRFFGLDFVLISFMMIVMIPLFKANASETEVPLPVPQTSHSLFPLPHSKKNKIKNKENKGVPEGTLSPNTFADEEEGVDQKKRQYHSDDGQLIEIDPD